MFALIGIGILIVYGVLVFYIGWSGWSWMKPLVAARFRMLYILVVAFLACSFILARFFSHFSVLSIIGSYWMAVFALLLLMLPVVHVTMWLLRLTRLPRRRVHKWAGSLTLAALSVLIAYGSFNAYSPVVRVYDVHIDKEVQGPKQLKVVMAADMHFGLLSGKAHAKRMVEEIAKLQPDLVLYPGDMIDDDLDVVLRRGIGDIIGAVEAPYGVYASLGNHDKTRGPIEELIAALEASNMTVLYDESVTIDGLMTIIGRKDRTERDRAALAELTAGVDGSLPLVLLDHQPYEFDIAERGGIDLMLSGHTHRGQIAPAHLITRAMYENDWGYLRKGELHSVVTSGYGFWGPPIRIGSRSELVQINLSFR